jgi:hypothetical protein
MENGRLIRAFFNNAEMKAITLRIGYFAFFPFIQPEQTAFSFDLSLQEERLAASVLLTLARKENNGMSNLKKPSTDGSSDGFTLGVPESWADVANIPESGQFAVCYVGSAEKNFASRSELLSEWGGWPSAVESQDSVGWWGRLEASEDIIWLVAILGDGWGDDFSKIWIVDETCVAVGAADFESGVLRVADGRASEADAGKLASIFAHLDADADGLVKEQDLAFLNCYWRGLQHTARDFARLCNRTFRSISPTLGIRCTNDDSVSLISAFSCAWFLLMQKPPGDETSEVDSDVSDALGLEAFIASAERIGFFGNSADVFSFLDVSRKGVITKQEFKRLERLL